MCRWTTNCNHGRGARVYEFNSGTNSWTKIGSNFAAAGFDKVSISADGTELRR